MKFAYQKVKTFEVLADGDLNTEKLINEAFKAKVGAIAALEELILSAVENNFLHDMGEGQNVVGRII